MNIFVVSHSWLDNAKALDDKRLNKMLLESVQLLSSALISWGMPAPYKMSHKNHPCTLWVSNHRYNFNWMLIQTVFYYTEYKYRFGKLHKSGEAAKLIEEQTRDRPRFVPENITYVNCSFYKEETDVFSAYKKTLVHKWQNDKRPPKWTKRERPEWYV